MVFVRSSSWRMEKEGERKRENLQHTHRKKERRPSRERRRKRRTKSSSSRSFIVIYYGRGKFPKERQNLELLLPTRLREGGGEEEGEMSYFLAAADLAADQITLATNLSFLSFFGKRKNTKKKKEKLGFFERKLEKTSSSSFLSCSSITISCKWTTSFVVVIWLVFFPSFAVSRASFSQNVLTLVLH